MTVYGFKNYTPKTGWGLIYMYTLDDGTRYIGQTIKSLKIRHQGHLSLYQVIDVKLRQHKFSLEVLDEVPIEELDFAEKYYIKEFNTLYPNGLNFSTGGHQNRQLTEESRERIRKAHSGSNHRCYGTHHSYEMRRKISEALKGENHPMYGKRGYETYNHKPVIQIDITTGQEIARYSCAAEAGRILGLHNRHIGSVCRGERKTCGGYSWKFVNNEVKK